MSPFYRGFDPNLKLDAGDVQEFQELYGVKSTVKTTTQSTEPDDGAFCKISSLDAVLTIDGVIYVFQGDKYYRLSDNTVGLAVADGYPKTISEGWPGLPSNLNAAFHYKNGKTYFFKGSKYWKYSGRTLDGKYPKEIDTGFPGIPDDIDAATVWGGNTTIFFYKGSKFWRFDPRKQPPVKSTFPKPLSNWAGIPDNIDAALQHPNGNTYFFKGDKYYRFNDTTFAVSHSKFKS